MEFIHDCRKTAGIATILLISNQRINIYHLTLPLLSFPSFPYINPMRIIDLIFELYKHNILTKIFVDQQSIWKSISNMTSEHPISIQTIANHPEIQKEISGISRNSQKVQQNDLFVCIQGSTFDGHTILNTLDVTAFLCEKEVDYMGQSAVLMVKNTRKAMGIAASLFIKNPLIPYFVLASQVPMGKTTTVSMIEQFCDLARDSHRNNWNNGT